MSKVRVIESSQLPSLGHWATRWAAYGVGFSLLIILALDVLARFRGHPAATSIVVAVWLAVVLRSAWTDAKHARCWGYALVSGFVMGASFGLITLLLYEASFGIAGIRIGGFGYVIVLAVMGLLVFWCIWLLYRACYGPIIIQDGTLCRVCAYCLRGLSRTGVCPECGTEYGTDSTGSLLENSGCAR
jgi:hypothetical protein